MTPRYTITQGGTVQQGNFPPVESPTTHGEPQVSVEVDGTYRVTVVVQFCTGDPIELTVQLE